MPLAPPVPSLLARAGVHAGDDTPIHVPSAIGVRLICREHGIDVGGVRPKSDLPLGRGITSKSLLALLKGKGPLLGERRKDLADELLVKPYALEQTLNGRRQIDGVHFGSFKPALRCFREIRWLAAEHVELNREC